MATRNRLYKLHYLLRKKGNEVNVKDRTVYRRAKLTPRLFLDFTMRLWKCYDSKRIRYE